MQARRSGDPSRLSMGSQGYGRGGDRQGLIHAYDEEENTGFGLTDLADDSDSEDAPLRTPDGKPNGKMNGHKHSFSEDIGHDPLSKTMPR